jgi:glycosyltransferase involved in cell wall biosynthesis
MPDPTVTFIVPCYKLAHLLRECVDSILGQTYKDLEVLIMDDHSPDDTAAVAKSFNDERVRYIYNDPNLGHLRNYNKGIELSRGKYIWLISADDYLRKPYVLQKYVDAFEANPKVGYSMCTGYGVVEGVETELFGAYAARGDRDLIIPGHVLFNKLIRSNFVLTASGMVRREAYQKVGLFPLDMPWCGDWYLFCRFAMHFDVAYFSEPMVCYRKHALSMTNKLWEKEAIVCCEEEVAVSWRIKIKAEEEGLPELARRCLDTVGEVYARNMVRKRPGVAGLLTLEQFEESLAENCPNEKQRERVREQTYAAMGNEYYWREEFDQARRFYLEALKKNPFIPGLYAKVALLSAGKPGIELRKTIFAFRS